MNSTKRLFAPVSAKNPNNNVNGFLIPNYLDPPSNTFLNIHTGKKYVQGRSVYISIEITAQDFYNRIMAQGKILIPDEQAAISIIESYFEQIQPFKFGDIGEVIFEGQHFQLIKKPRLQIPVKIP